jgi:hypothetical protein
VNKTIAVWKSACRAHTGLAFALSYEFRKIIASRKWVCDHPGVFKPAWSTEKTLARFSGLRRYSVSSILVCMPNAQGRVLLWPRRRSSSFGGFAE